MSAFSPFMAGNFPLKPLKFVAPLRGEKVDVVPTDGEFLGLEQFESWTGKLSDVQLEQQPEGGANVFKPGDVLFGKLRPYLAKGWAAERQGFCTTESLVLCPSEMESRFLKYCLLTPEFVDTVNGSTYGSKMPRADWSFIGSVQIPCPSRVEQARIAEFLDEQTARIDALIQEKECLKKALVEWHSAELTRHCYGTDTAGAATSNDWIPLLPSGWSVVRLKHLVLGIEQGWSPECEARNAEEDEWGVLKAGAANGGRYRELEHKALPGHLQPIAELEVKAGDVLITRASGTAEYVGSFAYVYQTRPRLMLSDKNFRLKFATSPRLQPELLAWVANTDTVRQQVLQFVSGADGLAKNIGSGNLREVWFPVPPTEEQQKILTRIRQSRERAESLSVHLDEHLLKLREYRASLISAAVTGQLDVSQFKAAA